MRSRDIKQLQRILLMQKIAAYLLVMKYFYDLRSACCTNIIDSITDRGGQTTTNTHDALKRLTRVSGNRKGDGSIK